MKTLGGVRLLHIGRSGHAREVKINDEHDQRVCVSRVTLAMLAASMRY